MQQGVGMTDINELVSSDEGRDPMDELARECERRATQ